MGQGLSSGNHRYVLVYVPSVLLSGVMAFSLISHTRGSKGSSGSASSRRLPHPGLPHPNSATVRRDAVTVPAKDAPPSAVAKSLSNPEGHSLDAFVDSYSLYQRIHSPSSTEPAPTDLTLEVYRDALQVLADAFRLYGPACVFGSYNGGKDAVVIMHLMRAALAAYSAQHGVLYRPRLIYFTHPKEFPEVEKLVYETAKQYDLELIVYDIGFVGGLTKCVEDAQGAPLGFVLGTRKGDPNCGNQQAFAPSSDWMPPFMRVNPILDWTYGQVWEFLRDYELPYCHLYDEGFTSLGKVDDTIRNPALRKPDGSYSPAFALSDWSLERAGRVEKAKPKATPARDEDKSATAAGGEGTGAESEASSSGAAAAGGLPRGGAVPSTISEAELAAQAELASDFSGVSLGSCELGSGADGSSGFDAALGGRKGSDRMLRQARTAGLIIIGDEILAAKTQDSNSAFAIQRLRADGVALKRAVLVSDDFDTIRDEVRRQSQVFDIVITSGGVGPTHDDVTIKSVAEAFGQRMSMNPRMLRTLVHKFGKSSADELQESQRKMALLPDRARLRFPPCTADGKGVGAESSNQNDDENDDVNAWPILQCENVFVLPGVPQFFEEKLDVICDHFLEGAGRAIYSVKVSLSLEESLFAAPLETVVAAFPNVAIGSYPYFNHPDQTTEHLTVITLDAPSASEANAAADALLAAVPPQHKSSVLKVSRSWEDEEKEN